MAAPKRMRARPGPPTTAPAVICPCKKDHSQATYRATYDALQLIIEAGKQATVAHEYESGLTAWVESLKSASMVLGAKTWGTLNTRLEEMFRREADWQAAGWARGDKQAGEYHGGRRGLVQDAQYWIIRARQALSDLKVFEAKQARRRGAREQKRGDS